MRFHALDRNEITAIHGFKIVYVSDVMAASGESKIVFTEGPQIRALCGHIIEEDNSFITLSRNDGEFRIAKSCIIKIERLHRR